MGKQSLFFIPPAGLVSRDSVEVRSKAEAETLMRKIMRPGPLVELPSVTGTVGTFRSTVKPRDLNEEAKELKNEAQGGQ